MRLIGFILVILGGINWLMIGGLQYDFVAGIFGTQANIFSRIIYLVIGAASIYIAFVTLINKGKLKLFGYKKKKQDNGEENQDK